MLKFLGSDSAKKSEIVLLVFAGFCFSWIFWTFLDLTFEVCHRFSIWKFQNLFLSLQRNWG